MKMKLGKEAQNKADGTSRFRKDFVVHQKRLREVILNVAASIIFTCALGLFFIHASILWQHYQNGYEFWTDTSPYQSLLSMEKAIFMFARHKSNIYEWSGEQLRVNTSLFVW